jgi:hypothetical protein
MIVLLKLYWKKKYRKKPVGGGGLKSPLSVKLNNLIKRKWARWDLGDLQKLPDFYFFLLLDISFALSLKRTFVLYI